MGKEREWRRKEVGENVGGKERGGRREEGAWSMEHGGEEEGAGRREEERVEYGGGRRKERAWRME